MLFFLVKFVPVLTTLCMLDLLGLGPVYMEKSCPGKAGHPPSRVNFSERLYEKKLTPLPEPTALAHALIVSARRVTLPAEPTFCFSCKQFAKFCKEM